MLDFKIEMTGDDALRAVFSEWNARIQAETERSMGFIVLRLQKQIRTHKLLGQVLNRRTGNLRKNILREVSADGGSVTGVVGIGRGAPYGRLHEFGFAGTQSVAAHIRRQKAAWGRRLKTPIDVHVSAHSRRVKLPERSFMRTAFSEVKPLIAEEIAAALARSAP